MIYRTQKIETPNFPCLNRILLLEFYYNDQNYTDKEGSEERKNEKIKPPVDKNQKKKISR